MGAESFFCQSDVQQKVSNVVDPALLQAMQFVHQCIDHCGLDSEWSSRLAGALACLSSHSQPLQEVLCQHGWMGTQFKGPPDRQALLSSLVAKIGELVTIPHSVESSPRKKTCITEEMHDRLHELGGSNELVREWATLEENTWVAEGPYAEQIMNSMVRKMCLQLLRRLSDFTSLGHEGWVDATVLLDLVWCRMDKTSRVYEADTLAKICIAMVGIIRKFSRWDSRGPRGSELHGLLSTAASWMTCLRTTVLPHLTTSTDSPQAPATPTEYTPHDTGQANFGEPALEIENVHKQELKILEAVDWHMTMPSVHSWICTICKRFDVITSGRSCGRLKLVWDLSMRASHELVYNFPTTSEYPPRRVANAAFCWGLLQEGLLSVTNLCPESMDPYLWQNVCACRIVLLDPSKQLPEQHQGAVLEILELAADCSWDVLKKDFFAVYVTRPQLENTHAREDVAPPFARDHQQLDLVKKEDNFIPVKEKESMYTKHYASI